MAKTAVHTKTPAAQRELIGLPEAAERCGVHYRTFRRWVRTGYIPAIRVGPKLLKVHAADVDKILNGGAA